MHKSIVRNSFFNMIYKGINVLFPLITVSYVSRILGAAGIGEVSSAQNIVTYFIMFASLGIPTYGIKAIAKLRNDSNKRNKVFSELFILNLISTVLSAIIYFIVINSIDSLNKMSELLNLFSILFILNIFNIDWLFQGEEEYKFIAIRGLIIKIISLILMITFVNEPKDLIIYAMILCFGTAGNYILNIIRLNKFVKFDFKKLNIFKHLNSIVILFSATVAIEFYSLLDVTMLTEMTNSISVGYYSNAVKMIKMLAGIFTAIGAVLLPRLSIYFEEKRYKDIRNVTNNFLNVILFLAIPSCIGISVLSKKIILILFGNDFLPAVETIRILSPLVILMPLSGGVFGQMLLTNNGEKKFLKCVCIGTLINAILNYLFIPIAFQDGAAIASVITECVVTGLMILSCNKMIKLMFNIKEAIKIIFSAIFMGVIIRISDSILCNTYNIISIFLEVLIGCVVYFIIMLLLRNNIAVNVKNYIVNKVRVKDSIH